jgi:hypothetical protein
MERRGSQRLQGCQSGTAPRHAQALAVAFTPATRSASKARVQPAESRSQHLAARADRHVCGVQAPAPASSTADDPDNILLSSGARMPLVGLGTYLIDSVDAIRWGRLFSSVPDMTPPASRRLLSTPRGGGRWGWAWRLHGSCRRAWLASWMQLQSGGAVPQTTWLYCGTTHCTARRHTAVCKLGLVITTKERRSRPAQAVNAAHTHAKCAAVQPPPTPHGGRLSIPGPLCHTMRWWQVAHTVAVSRCLQQ